MNSCSKDLTATCKPKPLFTAELHTDRQYSNNTSESGIVLVVRVSPVCLSVRAKN